MRARDCVWRQPSDADCGPSIQLTRKPPGCWVNSAEQEQVRRGRGHNRISPVEMPAQRQVRFSRIGPQPKCRINGRLCKGQTSGSVIDLQSRKTYRVQRLAGNRRERSWDHEQLPY